MLSPVALGSCLSWMEIKELEIWILRLHHPLLHLPGCKIPDLLWMQSGLGQAIKWHHSMALKCINNYLVFSLFYDFFFPFVDNQFNTLFFSLNKTTWDLCVMFGLPNECSLPTAVNMLCFSTCSQVGQRWLYRELFESSINCLINLICLQNLWFMVVLLGKLKEYDSVFDWYCWTL